MPPPPGMIPPDLDDQDEEMIAFFWDLSRDRTYTQGGPGAIPWSKCREYALSLGYGRYEDLYDDFMFIIGSMDQLYLKIQMDNIKREQSKAEQKRPRR